MRKEDVAMCKWKLIHVQMEVQPWVKILLFDYIYIFLAVFFVAILKINWGNIERNPLLLSSSDDVASFFAVAEELVIFSRTQTIHYWKLSRNLVIILTDEC